MALPGYARWVLMLGALGGTLYLTLNAPQGEDVAVVSAQRPTAAAGSAHPVEAVATSEDWRNLLTGKRAWKEEVEGADPFMVRLPAPPKTAKNEEPPPPPPEAPEAPELPFKFMGGFNRGGSDWAVYLLNGDKFYTVKIGDVLDEKYRVDNIGGGVINFTYLPLNIQQELIIGGM